MTYLLVIWGVFSTFGILFTYDTMKRRVWREKRRLEILRVKGEQALRNHDKARFLAEREV